MLLDSTSTRSEIAAQKLPVVSDHCNDHRETDQWSVGSDSESSSIWAGLTLTPVNDSTFEYM